MFAELYNQKNEKVGKVEIPEFVFGIDWNSDLVHRALIVLMANKRRNIAHTKDRGEVSGGGRKPWRQKGTGRARHGSIRSPIWRGGGTTFGPRKEIKYEGKVNKKEKKKAFFSVLSKKFSDKEIKFIDDIKVEKTKTKESCSMVNNFLSSPARALFILSGEKREFKKSVKNLKNITALETKKIGLYDVILNKFIFIEKEAIKDLAKK